jgi:hypothetical protein
MTSSGIVHAFGPEVGVGEVGIFGGHLVEGLMLVVQLILALCPSHPLGVGLHVVVQCHESVTKPHYSKRRAEADRRGRFLRELDGGHRVEIETAVISLGTRQ